MYNKTRRRTYDTDQTRRHFSGAGKFPFVAAKYAALGVSTEEDRTGTHGTELGISRLTDKLELLE